ncbi:MAG: tetratricopeptide repeat protein [Verrucomicrobiota bacterium]
MKRTVPLLFSLLLSPCLAWADNFPQKYQAALSLYNSGKLSDAKLAFENLIQSAPTTIARDEALVFNAYLETRLKNDDAASALAAQIHDKHLSVLCQLNTLALQNKYIELVAISKDLDFNTWPDPLMYEAFTSRANALARTRHPESAIADFQSALKSTASDYEKAQVYLRLGSLYSDQDKSDPRALAAYSEIYNLKGGLTVLCKAGVARAKLLASQGKGDAAMREFENLKQITQQPHWSMIQIGRAEVATQLGLTDEATASYKAITTSVNPPADALEMALSKLQSKVRP